MSRIAVAISTTGEPHRMDFLRASVAHWDDALPSGASLFVTVDGSRAEAERAAHVVSEWTASVFRVGQADHTGDRMGVAVNKNTGIELMIDNARAEHLFLCDDDTWPRNARSLKYHLDLGMPHSMICWGRHRKPQVSRNREYADWAWPRGVMLYATSAVIDSVGGMVEEFGPGGHEHVEWSKRIHRAGLTPVDFPTPVFCTARGATGAIDYWHAEDMPRHHEPLGSLRARRKHITTVRRADGDWQRIEQVMKSMEGSTAYVPFRAADNGRASATISPSRA